VEKVGKKILQIEFSAATQILDNVKNNHEVDERKKEAQIQVAQQHYLQRAAPHCNVDT